MKFLPRLSSYENIFDNIFPDTFFKSSNMYMKTDIRETKDNYVLDMEIPGFKKENVLLELHDGYLTVTVNKSDQHEEKDEKGNLIRQERFSGSCSRSFFVGDNVKDSDINANYTEGVLRISLPKTI